MMKHRCPILAAIFALLFLLTLFAVLFVDVQSIGPEYSEIGLGTLNGAVRDALGASELWYDVTEIFGFVAIAVALGFALLGLFQLIKRKSLRKVDRDLLFLAVLYVVMAVFYILFEIIPVNFRPILIDGVLEASFPSSHTMLVTVILGSAIYEVCLHLKNRPLQILFIAVFGVLILLTALGRLLAGVHWLTDVFAGLMLSGALIFSYLSLCETYP